MLVNDSTEIPTTENTPDGGPGIEIADASAAIKQYLALGLGLSELFFKPFVNNPKPPSDKEAAKQFLAALDQEALFAILDLDQGHGSFFENDLAKIINKEMPGVVAAWSERSKQLDRS